MISVKSVMAGSPVIGIVKPGDIILSINKNLIKSYRDYEVASQSDDLVIELWRNNELLELKVKTSQLEGNGVKDVFFWAGAHIHEPHRALRQRGIENDGVYVAFNNYGSPATRYGLKAGLSIIAVDDIPTPNLDIFKKIVMDKPSNDSIKLNVVSWNGSHSVVTLKLNNKYWPSYEISQKENIWKRNAFL
jgi:S1-C subfamily serine protease